MRHRTGLIVGFLLGILASAVFGHAFWVRAQLTERPGCSTDHPIDVHIEQGSLAPRFSDADAQRVADEANRLAHQSLTITIGAATKPVDPPTIASWLRAVPVNDSLTVGIDDATVVSSLSSQFGTAGHPAVDASFTVEDGKLYTYSIDRADGKIRWRRECPRDRSEPLDKRNNPASPSPVTDGENVYVAAVMEHVEEAGTRHRTPCTCSCRSL